jgi:hypothetical protein
MRWGSGSHLEKSPYDTLDPALSAAQRALLCVPERFHNEHWLRRRPLGQPPTRGPGSPWARGSSS